MSCFVILIIFDFCFTSLLCTTVLMEMKEKWLYIIKTTITKPQSQFFVVGYTSLTNQFVLATCILVALYQYKIITWEPDQSPSTISSLFHKLFVSHFACNRVTKFCAGCQPSCLQGLNIFYIILQVELLEQELAELKQALADKREQETAMLQVQLFQMFILQRMMYTLCVSPIEIFNYFQMLQVLMRVEQEQRVTEDARISAEQDAAAQRYAVHVLQVLSDL